MKLNDIIEESVYKRIFNVGDIVVDNIHNCKYQISEISLIHTPLGKLMRFAFSNSSCYQYAHFFFKK